MKISLTETSSGLSASAMVFTAAFGKANGGYEPEGSFHHHIYLIKDHGSDDDVMKVKKHAEADIRLVYEMS